jgi:mannonate dehydratase
MNDADTSPGTLSPISYEELWRRLATSLEEVVPVAEASGVRLAAHPDDPPMPIMRQQPRLVISDVFTNNFRSPIREQGSE